MTALATMATGWSVARARRTRGDEEVAVLTGGYSEACICGRDDIVLRGRQRGERAHGEGAQWSWSLWTEKEIGREGALVVDDCCM